MPKSRSSKKHRGLTLIELVLVLVILVALAAMVVPLFNGREIDVFGDGRVKKSPEQIATEATMAKIRDVIMGTPNSTGVWADVGQRPANFPRYVSDLLSPTKPAYIEARDQFDPITRTGWRGPYLVGHSRIVDAWGREFEIQVPEFDLRYVRLVSKGKDGEPQTDATQRILDDTGDDIVLFFRVADMRQ